MPQIQDKNKSADQTGILHRIKGRGELNCGRLAEKKLPSWIFTVAEPKWQRWFLIIGTSLLAAFMMAPKSTRIYNLTVGEPASETIVSPITFKVVDEEATSKNRDEVLKSVRPVYDFDDEMVHDIEARINQAFRFMRQYLEEEAEYSSREADGGSEERIGERYCQGGRNPRLFASLTTAR